MLVICRRRHVGTDHPRLTLPNLIQEPKNRPILVRSNEQQSSVRHLIDRSSHHSFLQQNYTWGRFYITYAIFKQLCSHLYIFPRFLNFVLGFGFKLRDTDSSFGGFQYRIHEVESDKLPSFGNSPPYMLKDIN